MVNKLSTKERMVAEWGEAVKTLKVAIDASQQEATTLREQIEQYKAGYTLFIANLEQERSELENRISDCRLQIQYHLEPAPEAEIQAEPETQAEADEELEDVPPLEDAPFQERSKEVDPVQEIIEPDESAAQAKDRTYRFFAKLLHPDKERQQVSTPSIPLPMQQLNLINKEAIDEIDLLIAIPWGEEWLQRGEKESIGVHLERLIDWKDGLEEAQTRVEQTLSNLKQDIYYSGLLQKQVAAEQDEDDHFAQLAQEYIEEIERLTQTLSDLQTHLNALQEEKANG